MMHKSIKAAPGGEEKDEKDDDDDAMLGFLCVSQTRC